MKTNIQFTLLAALLFSNSILANAQKLPNKQEGSIYAPVELKIDGSAAEWSDVFHAYNHATEVSYTLCNDDNRLYFVFRATEEAVIQKIINGGITIAVSAINKKSGIRPVIITYPVVPWLFAQVNYVLKPPAPLSDAEVLAINKKINDHMKEIKISGVKSIPDSSVSVYNDQGIQGAHRVDNKKNYTCEISFPLTFIRQLINDKETFAYRVKINGIDLKTTKIIGGRPTGDPTPSDSPVPHGMEYDISPTYFTAIYTLAKKP